MSEIRNRELRFFDDRVPLIVFFTDMSDKVSVNVFFVLLQ